MVLNDGEYILNQHSDIPIIGHIKVKGNKSPYDGDWTYWSSRIGKHPGLRKEVTTLLKRQKAKCVSCRLHFRPTVEIEVDHIVPRSKVVTTLTKINNCCTDIATTLKLPRIWK